MFGECIYGQRHRFALYRSLQGIEGSITNITILCTLPQNTQMNICIVENSTPVSPTRALEAALILLAQNADMVSSDRNDDDEAARGNPTPHMRLISCSTDA